MIPYDGRSGTTRRPIYIECTKNGIRFAGEDVMLGPHELEHFTSRYNPLLAGVRALTAYWTHRNITRPAGVATQHPYVLLIVRPDGAIAYYLARKYLQHWGKPFGYELVKEDFPLHLPRADPEAKRAINRAVASVLKSRSDVMT